MGIHHVPTRDRLRLCCGQQGQPRKRRGGREGRGRWGEEEERRIGGWVNSTHHHADADSHVLRDGLGLARRLDRALDAHLRRRYGKEGGKRAPGTHCCGSE